MFERIIKTIREKIRTNQYVITLHADEEMDNDDLSIFDIERCILNGKITERNKEKETGEWKYTVIGHSIQGYQVGMITKISITGKLVIITVYKL
ncbi:DUF4258 domain-containing protein [candidate division KSB1 bacterium]|nr:DUF4258 domain-containing protein [candidate division KSB1 bacterium]